VLSSAMPATRAYNSFRIDEASAKIVKVSSTERLKDEICYYSKIEKTPLKHFFPRTFEYNIEESPYEIELEYYDYDDLGLQMVDTESAPTEAKWVKIADKLVSTLNAFENISIEHDSPQKIKKEMYVDKTLHYQQELISSSHFFAKLNKQKKLKVNGENILNFNQIWDTTQDLIKQTLINDKPLCAIHGDMCFSNILCSGRKNIMRFIDPRGSFGERGIWGDPLYDVAKLIHSFAGGYEYIINDKFDLKQLSDDSFEFSFHNKNHELIKNAFLNYSKFDSVAPRLIQGLIFIGMCSRHYDSPDRQIVMYLTGLKILNKLIS